MSDNRLRLIAAEAYAEKKGMSTHEAFESEDFQNRFNNFLKHPNSEKAQKAVGLTRQLQKEGEAEERENNFRRIQEIWRYAIDGGCMVATIQQVNKLINDASEILDLGKVHLSIEAGIWPEATIKAVDIKTGRKTEKALDVFQALMLIFDVIISKGLISENGMYEVVRTIGKCLAKLNVPYTPVITVLSSARLNVDMYCIIPMPTGMLDEPVEEWKKYCMDNVSNRFMSDVVPSGIYLETGELVLAYSNLLCAFLLDPSKVEDMRN